MKVLLIAMYQLALSALPAGALANCENGCQFTTLILTCHRSLEPSECNENTAIDFTRGPRTNSAFMCGKGAQTTMAGTVLAPGPDQYQKIECVRERRPFSP